MKILLINPPNSVDSKISFNINVFQPLGLAYVASVLDKNNYQVKILDALAEGFDQERIVNGRRMIGLSYSQIRKEIIKFNPDIVGVTAPFSFQSHEAHEVVDLVKKIRPSIVTVVGGSHPTIQPEDMIGNKNVDYVVRGEGEYVMLDLVRALERNRSVKNIKGLTYRGENGKVIDNQRGEPIMSLDELPFPSRHLLPMDKYFQASKKGRVIDGLLAFGKNRTSIITSRGCPFTCTFCSVHLTMTRIWRPRTPESVVEEIKSFVKDYKIEYFDILDDNFTLLPQRAKEICRLLIKEKLKVNWTTPNGIRADRVDEELIILMKKAGCLGIKVAPESGNQEVLDKIIKKNLDLKKVKKVVALCKKHQLPVEAFFVIGFPEETESNIWDTINYGKELRRLGCNYCYFFIATPYFGTEMYKNAVEKGYLNESLFYQNRVFTAMNKTLLKNPNFSPERLGQLLKIAARINPPVTKERLIPGIRLFFADPSRVSRYLFNYINNFFS